MDDLYYVPEERITTEAAAHAAAVERWGWWAAVNGNGEEKCVGTFCLVFFEVKGHGKTWDLAFADADRRRAQEVK